MVAAAGQPPRLLALARRGRGRREEMLERRLQAAELAMGDAEVEMRRVARGAQSQALGETHQGALEVAQAVADEAAEHMGVETVRMAPHELGRARAGLDHAGLDQLRDALDLGLDFAFGWRRAVVGHDCPSSFPAHLISG